MVVGLETVNLALAAYSAMCNSEAAWALLEWMRQQPGSSALMADGRSFGHVMAASREQWQQVNEGLSDRHW